MNEVRLPHVAVYRELLLGASETFIRNQVSATTGWKALLCGLGRDPSPLIEDDDTLLLPNSRLRRRAFKITRRSRLVTSGIAALQPDLLHAHFGMDAAVMLPTAQRLGIPLIATFHGVDVNVLPHSDGVFAKLYQRRLPELFSHAAGLVANSDFLAGRLLQLGAPAEKLHVLPIGIPIEPFDDLPEQHERKGVLFVGRLTEVKGAADAIRAYAALPESTRSQHPFRVIGDGELRSELQELSNSLNLDVQFLGMLSADEVRINMAAAAVLLGPSKPASNGAVEAFGIVFLEAAAAGLPTLAYRCGGVPEAMAEDETGLLAEVGNTAELSRKLHHLLNDEQIRAEMGRNGRDFVRRHFDIRERTLDLEQLYRTTANASHQS